MQDLYRKKDGYGLTESRMNDSGTHLNNRAVINGTMGAVEQTVAYYPFGGVIADLGTPAGGQPYKFDYYPLSPYLYCGNDPVNNADPTGLIFTDESRPYIDQLLFDIENNKNNERIGKKIYEMNQDGLSEKKINKILNGISKLQAINSSLEQVKSEIKILDESSQVYNVVMNDAYNIPDNRYGGSGEIVSISTYNYQTDMFDIMLGDDSLGMLAHELKHAYQFETGNFSSGFLKNGEPFYDITDEYEAYERGYLFGQPKNYNIAKQYGYLQKSTKGVSSLIELLKNNNKELQKYANRTHSTFRWQSITYKFKKINHIRHEQIKYSKIHCFSDNTDTFSKFLQKFKLISISHNICCSSCTGVNGVSKYDFLEFTEYLCGT